MNNSLSVVHPELIVEWSKKNLPLTPDGITFGSNKVVCPNIFGINCQAKIKKTTIVPVLIKKTRDCHFRHYRN